jgi:lycopene beta-cyclase
MAATPTCDVAILGAGLAGGLIALALAERHPALDVRLIDADTVVGGNHLWSFFGADVAEGDRWLVAPLVSHRWPAYDVRFPGHARTLGEPYHSVESERLDRVVRASLPAHALMLGRSVAEHGPTQAVLADGERVTAGAVIDARGAGDLSVLELGWQKFVGRELTVDGGHGLERPIVMDATVPQIDGYRFIYCLPFDAERVFVEDTYYSDTPALDVEHLTGEIDRYAAGQGWRQAGSNRQVRLETGVLPVVMGGDFERYWQSGGAGVAKAGMRAGLFHPTTGYSFPDAVRLASRIAGASDFGARALHALTHDHARAAWAARGFYRMLDTMLFKAADPDQRYRVLERFYRLRPDLIGRFYAGQSTLADKARVLMGKPPVPFTRAVKAVLS